MIPARNKLRNISIRNCGADKVENYEAYLDLMFSLEVAPEAIYDNEWEYHFNSLGYRSEEYNEAADFRVCSFGASNTFGAGVDESDTYTTRLANKLSSNLPGQVVNCLNFGEGGAPNDRVSRLAVTQLASIKADLLVVNFSTLCRRERLGQSQEEGSFWFVPSRAEKAPRDPLNQAYLEQQSPAEDLLNLAKNIFVVQQLAETTNTPLVILFKNKRLGQVSLLQYVEEHSSVRPFFNCIKKENIVCLNAHFARQIDYGRDLRHDGPESHRLISELLFEKIKELYF